MRPLNAKIIIPLLLLAIYALLLAQPINMVTADLGRHIKNGEIVFQNPEVLKTNFYSYTHPDFPAINHHWLSGLIFFLVWKISGLAGMHGFFITLSLITLGIFYALAIKRSNILTATLVGLLIIPILLERKEIRPEIFSYLFSGIYFWILLKVKSGEYKPNRLFILPALQIIWANLHIYFFAGPLLIGVFLAESFIKKSPLTKRLGLVFIASIAATALTPFGINSTLAPLTIFQNFGYHLVENQTVWFIEKILPNPNFFIFKIIFSVLILSFILRARQKPRVVWPDLLLGLALAAAGWLAIRNFAIFGLFALPIISGNIAAGLSRAGVTDRPNKNLDSFKNKLAVIGLLIIVLLATLSGELRVVYPYSQYFYLGDEKLNNAAADFFKKENLKGPIFNNYDIGSYLIYGLYPQERVFVDNRPEAYPADFFTQIYIPMQENKEIWNEKSDVYKFNAIIFSYRDYTPWGQVFFARILADPEWTSVFADSRIIILLKNNELNKNIIAKYGRSIKIGHQTNN